ncbi:hypothetical protein JOD67_004767 [Tenggerimyces flavus]|nr:hypothetical protein [Tenggerimyces flavus]
MDEIDVAPDRLPASSLATALPVDQLAHPALPRPIPFATPPAVWMKGTFIQRTPSTGG